MSEYEPVDLDHDVAYLLDQLMGVGRLAGRLMSRAAVEAQEAKKGKSGVVNPNLTTPQDAIVEMYDRVAQRTTVSILELQVAKGELALNE